MERPSPGEGVEGKSWGNQMRFLPKAPLLLYEKSVRKLLLVPALLAEEGKSLERGGGCSLVGASRKLRAVW